MISFKTRTFCAIAMLAASVTMADVAQAAAVQASAYIDGRTGTLLDFSLTSEYDIIATTRQLEDTRFTSSLPSIQLSDPDGFSVATVDNTLDPLPYTSAGAHDFGLGTSSVIWTFGYTATGSGTAVLDLSFGAFVTALNVAAGESAGGSALINIKRSGVQEAGAEAFYYLTGAGSDGDISDLLYAFNAVLGETGEFIVTVSSQAGTSPVPIPAAMWLLCSGLMGVGALRRRRSAAV